MARKKSEITQAELQRMSLQELSGLLVEKQKAFVREYMMDRNGTQAAIRAGYKSGGSDNHLAAVTASKLLKDPFVSAYRAALLKEEYQRMSVSLEEVCLEYMEIYRRCMAQVPVMEWDSEKKEWKPSGVWRFDAKGAALALDKLAGLMGFKDRQMTATSGKTVEEYLAALTGDAGGREY